MTPAVLDVGTEAVGTRASEVGGLFLEFGYNTYPRQNSIMRTFHRDVACLTTGKVGLFDTKIGAFALFLKNGIFF